MRRRSKRRERACSGHYLCGDRDEGTGDGGRKRTGLRLFFFNRAGAGACVRAHAPSWALRVRSTFISRQRTKDNGSSQRTPKERALNGKSKASKESSDVRAEASITLHSKEQEINQCHHLLRKGLREYRYQTGQGDAREP